MMSNNSDNLSRHIPRAICRKSSQAAMLLSMALFSFAFIIIFRPFNVYDFVKNDPGILANYGFTPNEAFYVATTIVVLCGLVLLSISRTIMIFYNRRHKLSYREYMFWIAAEFVFLAMFMTGFSSMVFHDERIIKTFVNVLIRATCILLIPFGYSLLYTFFVEKVQALKHLRESIENDEAQLQKSYVLFHDDKGLRLSVKRENLLIIESADNYVCVWYQNNGAVKKAMIRNTMKRVAEQLEESNIRRCHRSYMVNLDRVKVLRREKEGIFIELGLDGVPDIPISKTYADSITAWLMK